jgi:plasmid stabilization system protein ParE
MKLVFTPEAEEQADECDRWWRQHRDARDLFARELAYAKTLLREAPNVGSKYTVLDGLPVRRVLLPKTGTHVYYSIDADNELVMVLAVWGAPKGRAPKL